MTKRISISKKKIHDEFHETVKNISYANINLVIVKILIKMSLARRYLNKHIHRQKDLLLKVLQLIHILHIKLY